MKQVVSNFCRLLVVASVASGLSSACADPEADLPGLAEFASRRVEISYDEAPDGISANLRGWLYITLGSPPFRRDTDGNPVEGNPCAIKSTIRASLNGRIAFIGGSVEIPGVAGTGTGLCSWTGLGYDEIPERAWSYCQRENWPEDECDREPWEGGVVDERIYDTDAVHIDVIRIFDADTEWVIELENAYGNRRRELIAPQASEFRHGDRVEVRWWPSTDLRLMGPRGVMPTNVDGDIIWWNLPTTREQQPAWFDRLPAAGLRQDYRIAEMPVLRCEGPAECTRNLMTRDGTIRPAPPVP